MANPLRGGTLPGYAGAMAPPLDSSGLSYLNPTSTTTRVSGTDHQSVPRTNSNIYNTHGNRLSPNVSPNTSSQSLTPPPTSKVRHKSSPKSTKKREKDVGSISEGHTRQTSTPSANPAYADMYSPRITGPAIITTKNVQQNVSDEEFNPEVHNVDTEIHKTLGPW